MAKTTYRFHLRTPLNDEQAAALGEIPGLFLRDRLVGAPRNAAWIAQNLLAQMNVSWSLEPPKVRRKWSFEDVKKIAELREWTADFLAPFQRDAIVFALNDPSESAVLSHPTGCLTGDTELIINRRGCARRMRLDDLVAKFNGAITGQGKKWNSKFPTMTQSIVDGYTRLNRIVAAYETGVREVFAVKTRGGRTICATADHRFLVLDPVFPHPDLSVWLKLDSLRVGMLLSATSRGGMTRKRKIPYLQTQVKHHPHAVRFAHPRNDKWCDEHGYHRGYVEEGWRVPTHRLVVEADMNSLTFAAFVARLRAGDVKGLVFLDPKLHVHHMDEDFRNNARENLEVLTNEEHGRHHAKWENVTARVVPDEIVSIKSVGEQPTYDLTMASPHNNYVANGLVVHNSGKSLEGIVWGLATPGPVLFVTRASARRTIQLEVERYTTVRPAVLWPPSDRRHDPAMFENLHEQRIIIVGWDMLPAILEKLLNANAASIVFDELHRGKGHKRWQAIPDRDADGNDTKRFARLDNIVAAAARLAANAQRRLGMTATFIPDRIRDLWGQLDLIHPGEWGLYWGKINKETDTRTNSFTKRYCDLRLSSWGAWDERGESNLDELKKRLQFIVHRVDSKVTHRDLPPKRRQVVYLSKADQNPPSAFAEELRKAQKNRRSLQEVRLAEAASRKRGYIVDEVLDAVKSKQKVVIFTGRHRDCERLAEAIENAIPKGVPIFMAHGGHGTARRDEIQAIWMGNITNPNAGPPLEGPAVLVGTSQAWGECVAPDTLVLGRGQGKSIVEYKKGDAVLGASGVVSCRGMKTKHFDGDMIEVRGTGLLPIAATPNHPVLVLSGRITHGRDRHFEFMTEPKWKRIDELRPWDPSPRQPAKASGDFVLVPRLRGTVVSAVIDPHKYSIPVDVDAAWLLGLYVAEGSACSKDGTGRHWRAYWSLAAKERNTLGARVVQILAKWGFRSTINPLRKSNGINVTLRCGTIAHVLDHLCGHGAHNKHVPHFILNHTDDRIVQAFLDGYVAGDGHIHGSTKNLVSAVTVSKQLALELQLLNARFGRLATITPRLPPKRKSKIRGREVNGGPWFLVRWRASAKRWTRCRTLEDYIAVPIRTTQKRRYNGTVVDIGTTDHTFLVSNAVVHNSYSLHDTDLAILAMLPINARELWQSEGRFHRQGQRRSVLLKHIVAEGTYDEAVASILLSKLPAVADVQMESQFQAALDQYLGRGEEAAIEKKLLEVVNYDPDELFKEFTT